MSNKLKILKSKINAAEANANSLNQPVSSPPPSLEEHKIAPSSPEPPGNMSSLRQRLAEATVRDVIAVKEFFANDLRAMPPLFMIERLFVAVLQQSFVRIKDYVKIDFYLFITKTRALKNETFAFLMVKPIHSRKKGRTPTNVTVIIKSIQKRS
jgi:hypothetical protein